MLSPWRAVSGLLGLDDVHRVRAEERAPTRTDVEGGGGLEAACVVEVGSDDKDVLHVLRTILEMLSIRTQGGMATVSACASEENKQGARC